MSYRHIFNPTAFAEYKEAVTWYSERSKIIAANFINTADERIKQICNDPLRYRNIFKQFREISLKKYPYSIVYFIDENKKQIIIFSVYHHKRNPKKKFKNK